jgi:hypothetical protein
LLYLCAKYKINDFKRVLKRKIIKYLNKLLTCEHGIHVVDRVSLGIILNIDEVEDFELFRKLSRPIKCNANKLKVIAYSRDKVQSL